MADLVLVHLPGIQSLLPPTSCCLPAADPTQDLYNVADQRTLVHLLLRAEGDNSGDGVAGSSGKSSGSGSGRGYDLRQLHVERVMPQHAPEGSLWRKTKVGRARLAAPAGVHPIQRLVSSR